MRAHECYHCKQWVEADEAHDCWTTTETALTGDLSEDLQEAWQRLRETAADFGEQRIYASHKSIMFSRQSCYFFVRPKKSFLEVCVFLDRPVTHPRIKRVNASSRTKFVHTIQVRHRDEVEAPITDWLQGAYVLAGAEGGGRAQSADRGAKGANGAKGAKGAGAKGAKGAGAKGAKGAARAKKARRAARRSTRARRPARTR